jgi:hypothetical protein
MYKLAEEPGGEPTAQMRKASDSLHTSRRHASDRTSGD